MNQSKQSTTTVYTALRETACRRADSEAIIFKDAVLTYRVLLDRVDGAAAHLHRLGLRQGHTFAVFAQNSPEFLFAYFAAAKLGAVLVPLNFNLTAVEVDYILKHSEARFLFRDDFVANLDGLELSPGYLRPLSELSVTSILSNTSESSAAVEATADLLIAYTSGSTGVPKAVVLDHQAQLNATASFRGFWEMSEGDTTVCGAPFGFLLGLSTISAVALLTGARLVVNSRFHPGEVLEALTKYRATIFNGVPTMFSMMLEFAEERGLKFDLSHMRALISSGSPMADELRRRFSDRFGKAVQNYFGMTECYPLFGKYTSDLLDPPAGAAGKIAPGAALRIVDSSNNECAPGVAGELLARAPSTIKRYHKDPGLTAASFLDGWFRTGDVGYVHENGYVYLAGRLKELIKRGGANVAPAEVEGALMLHTAVQAAAVIGVADPKWSEVPVAFVVRRKGADLTADALMDFVAIHLAKFKVPSTIVFEDELPLGKTGKVDKAQLKARWQELQRTTP
jgi:long-chain acyl-CoA synthetase